MRSRVIGAVVATAVAVAVALGFFWATGKRATPVSRGDRLPPVELSFVMSKGTSRLDTIRGEPLLLVFIETQSPGGRAFANNMELLHRRYTRRGLNLVAIALDPDRATVARVLGADPITYHVLHDPAAAATQAAFGVSQPSDAYLVGADGVVLDVFVTTDDWTDLRVMKAIEAALPQKR